MGKEWDDTDSEKLSSSEKKSHLHVHNPTPSDMVQNIIQVF